MQRYSNPVKADLLAGKTASTLWLSLADQALAELAGSVDPDVVLFDVQHGPWDRKSLEMAIGALPAEGAVPFARPRINSDDAILDCLDSGAMGIIVPMVNNPDEAARAVRSAKYAPNGHRSVGGMRPAADLPRYHAMSNDEILVGVMIETVEGLDNVASIAAVEGVDMVFIGPTDLSISLGTFPEGGPKLEAAIGRILEATVAADKIPGMFTLNMTQARHRLDQGFKFVVAAIDTVVLIEGYRKSVAELRG